jgi:hypothetical protein
MDVARSAARLWLDVARSAARLMARRKLDGLCLRGGFKDLLHA